ncbi:MAG: STAS domain-containing protein [Phycisphaerales bacterium]
MPKPASSKLSEVLLRCESDILATWMQLQLSAVKHRGDLIKNSDLREQSARFLELVREGVQTGDANVQSGAAWAATREMLESLSRSRAKQGFTPAETASFVYSLKAAIFERLREEIGSNPQALVTEIITASELLDGLGLLTMEMYQKGREGVIARQQQELMELSTPVVMLWDGVLALPLIGTLDSGRTQVVMENLLQRIVETGASIAILDITGVPTVDTLVAQHLLKAVSAARLMGADCIISGIRPQIAQTIVHLGVDLGNVTTKATLAEAFRVALNRTSRRIVDADFQPSTTGA